MARLLRIAASFAVVLVTYWAYALVAVPWIEPPADLRPDESITAANRAGGSGLVESRLGQWKDLFEPDAWELKRPKILESSRVMLLMQDYTNLDGGQVKITPCTMILMPKGPCENEAQRVRRAVVLQAPDGALLQFDGPLDLSKAKIGRLKSGKLVGRITIRSQGKSAGPEDDLMIVTRDVQLDENLVRTPHPVDFRLGPNYGRGHQMRIKLLPADETNRADQRGPNIGGIESFELRRVERLHLDLNNAKSVSGQRANVAKGSRPLGGSSEQTPTDGLAKPSGNPIANLPVEITCRGPFRFDNVKKVATFEDRVDVLRINPTGPSDQLNCELLSIFFVDRAAAKPGGGKPGGGKPGGGKPAKAGTKKKPAAGLTDLEPQRIVARGNPVVVSVPSEREPVSARGQRLEYNLQSGRIVLDGTHQVMLQQGPNEIHARNLQYQPVGPGRLGRVVAQGPGWLRGRMAERPGEQLEAEWNQQLHVRPDEENQLISLTGGARLKFRGIGRLDAEEIHFWLLESPSKGPPARFQLLPDRMLARGNVRVDSPQLSSAVEQLEVWFEHPGMTPRVKRKVERGGPQTETTPGRRRRAGLIQTVYRPPLATGSAGGFPVSQSNSGVPLPSRVNPTATTGQRSAPTPAAQRQVRLVGRLLQARVLLKANREAELSELIVEDGVQFAETQTAEAGEDPLLITGDRLHVVDAATPYAAVTVVGRPAHFQGRGLALTGPSINLNRGTNRLWIDGPGRMDLPMDRDLEGRPLRSPDVLNVYWRERMVFDGRTARFEDSVAATAPNRLLRTETMEIRFKRAIRFSDPEIQEVRQDRDLFEQLLCHGGVFMESRSFEKQAPTSYERMEVADLVINRSSGALTAGGPGWLSSVRRGSDDPLAMATRTGTHTSQTIATPSPSGDGQLRGLYVRFQDKISGNLHRRETTFHGQVRTTYAPVDSWNTLLDTDDPDALGPGGVVMHCDRVTVNEMTTPAGTHRELEAAGNPVVEGRREDGTFTARGIRMTYTEAKGLLVLEGDGRTDAELFRQQQLGGPTSKVAARKILFWPESGRLGRLSIEDARSLESSWFSTGSTDKR